MRARLEKLARAVRARLTLDRIALAVVLVGAALVVTSLVEGTDETGSRDTAVRLVPPDALFYAHVTVDPGSPQWRRAGELVRKLPTLRRLRDRALESFSRRRRPLDFDTQIRPWIGDEAALALLPGGRRATSLILARVADQARARTFLQGAGEPQQQRHRGVVVRVYGELAAAFVGEFLAVGRARHVRAAIDAARGRALGADPTFRRAVDGLEVHAPIAYAYAPARGVAQLLREQRGLVGQLGALLETPLRGLAVALRAEPNGARLSVSSITPAGSSTRERDVRFEPTLLAAVPASAIAYLGAGSLDRVFERLERFGGGGESFLRVVERLRRPLGEQGERALVRAVRPLLGREAALMVTPPATLPVVTLLVAKTTPAEGGDLLLALQPVIARLLQAPSEAGQVAALIPRRIAGVEATTLRISPNLELTYAAFGGMVAATTSPAGIRQLRSGGDSLADNASFAPGGLRDFLQRASSVVFFDLRRLSTLVERAGLAASPGYRAIEPDLARIGALSGITASKRSSQTAEIFLEVP